MWALCMFLFLNNTSGLSSLVGACIQLTGIFKKKKKETRNSSGLCVVGVKGQ